MALGSTKLTVCFYEGDKPHTHEVKTDAIGNDPNLPNWFPADELKRITKYCASNDLLLAVSKMRQPQIDRLQPKDLNGTPAGPPIRPPGLRASPLNGRSLAESAFHLGQLIHFISQHQDVNSFATLPLLDIVFGPPAWESKREHSRQAWTEEAGAGGGAQPLTVDDLKDGLPKDKVVQLKCNTVFALLKTLLDKLKAQLEAYVANNQKSRLKNLLSKDPVSEAQALKGAADGGRWVISPASVWDECTGLWYHLRITIEPTGPQPSTIFRAHVPGYEPPGAAAEAQTKVLRFRIPMGVVRAGVVQEGVREAGSSARGQPELMTKATPGADGFDAAGVPQDTLAEGPEVRFAYRIKKGADLLPEAQLEDELNWNPGKKGKERAKEFRSMVPFERSDGVRAGDLGRLVYWLNVSLSRHRRLVSKHDGNFKVEASLDDASQFFRPSDDDLLRPFQSVSDLLEARGSSLEEIVVEEARSPEPAAEPHAPKEEDKDDPAVQIAALEEALRTKDHGLLQKARSYALSVLGEDPMLVIRPVTKKKLEIHLLNAPEQIADWAARHHLLSRLWVAGESLLRPEVPGAGTARQESGGLPTLRHQHGFVTDEGLMELLGEIDYREVQDPSGSTVGGNGLKEAVADLRSQLRVTAVQTHPDSQQRHLSRTISAVDRVLANTKAGDHAPLTPRQAGILDMVCVHASTLIGLVASSPEHRVEVIGGPTAAELGDQLRATLAQIPSRYQLNAAMTDHLWGSAEYVHQNQLEKYKKPLLEIEYARQKPLAELPELLDLRRVLRELHQVHSKEIETLKAQLNDNRLKKWVLEQFKKRSERAVAGRPYVELLTGDYSAASDAATLLEIYLGEVHSSVGTTQVKNLGDTYPTVENLRNPNKYVDKITTSLDVGGGIKSAAGGLGKAADKVDLFPYLSTFGEAVSAVPVVNVALAGLGGLENAYRGGQALIECNQLGKFIRKQCVKPPALSPTDRTQLEKDMKSSMTVQQLQAKWGEKLQLSELLKRMQYRKKVASVRRGVRVAVTCGIVALSIAAIVLSGGAAAGVIVPLTVGLGVLKGTEGLGHNLWKARTKRAAKVLAEARLAAHLARQGDLSSRFFAVQFDFFKLRGPFEKQIKSTKTLTDDALQHKVNDLLVAVVNEGLEYSDWYEGYIEAYKKLGTRG